MSQKIHPFVLTKPCFLSLTLCTDVVQFFRFRQRSIERTMDLTDSFTWEDLPTRDADTGHLTAAGWIPLIQKYTNRVAVVTLAFHCVQSTIRILKSQETMFIAWYPFDWTVSPFYELVNISQVTISQCKKKIHSKELYIILNLTV